MRLRLTVILLACRCFGLTIVAILNTDDRIQDHKYEGACCAGVGV